MSQFAFKIGDRVKSEYFGAGEIIGVRDEQNEIQYPMIVKFNNDDQFLCMFTVNGRYQVAMDDPKMDIRPANDEAENSLVDYIHPDLYPNRLAAWLCAPQYSAKRDLAIWGAILYSFGFACGGMLV